MQTPALGSGGRATLPGPSDRIPYVCNPVRRRYRARVRAMIDAIKAGASCAICGARDNLTFHHLPGRLKRFDIGNATRYRIRTVRRELRTCQVLCRRCHDAVHQGVIDGSRLVPLRLKGDT